MNNLTDRLAAFEVALDTDLDLLQREARDHRRRHVITAAFAGILLLAVGVNLFSSLAMPSPGPDVLVEPVTDDASNTELDDLFPMGRIGELTFVDAIPGEFPNPLAVNIEGVSIDQTPLMVEPGATLPGQEGVAIVRGHRTIHGSPLYKLDTVEVDDRIHTTHPSGETTYVVQAVVVVPADADLSTIVGPQARGQWLLVVSNHPRFSALQRLVVVARVAPVLPTLAPENDQARVLECDGVGCVISPEQRLALVTMLAADPEVASFVHVTNKTQFDGLTDLIDSDELDHIRDLAGESSPFGSYAITFASGVDREAALARYAGMAGVKSAYVVVR